AAPGMPGGALKPKRSATSTRRSAPSSAPIGANTELQDSANEGASVPPQDSLFALASSTPSRVADVCTGKLSEGLTVPASSAPVRVRILNVEPGGCRPLKPMPAAASTSPL